jgi:hypothetical protein
VRLRRPSGSAGRPLNFTVRGPSQMRAALKVLTACVLCGLTACHETPAETQAKLLQKLSQCLNEIPRTSPQALFSPCAKLDLTPLNGIARANLLGVLGPPTLCTLVNVPKGPDCPSQNNQWSFYSLPPNTQGGGPELTCEVDKMKRCAVVRWIYSE